MATPGWNADFGVYRSSAHYGNRASGSAAAGLQARNLGRSAGCRPGTVQCVVPGGNWYCADLNTDPFNCGACCRPCDEGDVCCRGRCVPRHRCDIPMPPLPPSITGGCPGGQERCRTPTGCKYCTNTQFDRRNCGGCNQACTRLDEVCCRGACVVATTEENCGSDCSRCSEGQRCCLAPTFDSAFNCVELGTREHCLSCNDTCSLTETCCPAGCANLDIDQDNCGVCGRRCRSREHCEFGRCECNAGTSRCGPGECCVPDERCCRDEEGVGRNCCAVGLTCCSDGTCRDLGSQLHCGACFDECAANERCCQNVCTPVNTVARCGDCGQSCEPGEECCRKGSRNLTVGNRSISVQNWECTRLGTNSDCNACSDACPAPKICQDRSCVCPTNRDPCGATCCAVGQRCCNGLCVDTRTDPQHCGACNNACAPPKVCDATGCHCPANRPPCGTTCCPVGQQCSNGICCATGLTNCGGQCVDLQTNASHCGLCGRAVTNFTFTFSNGSVQTVDLACVNGSPQCPSNFWVPCPPQSGMACCPARSPVCTGVTALNANGEPGLLCCPADAPTGYADANGFGRCR